MPRRIGKCFTTPVPCAASDARRRRHRALQRELVDPDATGAGCSPAAAAARRVRSRTPGWRRGSVGGSGTRSASRGGRARHRGSTPAARPRPADLRDRGEQPLGVRVPRRANSSSTDASSTTWPAYITMHAEQRSATTPRSWVTKITAMPSRACSDRSRSRIWACTVTSSAVVGSSAMSSRGSHDERQREQDALAHAAGQLVRVVARADARGRGCRPARAARRARARASRLLIDRCSRIASTSCLPIVNAGLRLVIGSWNTIAISSPRTSRISRNDSDSRSRPSNITEPRLMRPGGDATSRITASDVTVLPEPDSPTMPRTSPGATPSSRGRRRWPGPPR